MHVRVPTREKKREAHVHAHDDDFGKRRRTSTSAARASRKLGPEKELGFRLVAGGLAGTFIGLELFHGLGSGGTLLAEVCADSN